MGADDVAYENLKGSIGELDRSGKEIILIGDTNYDFKNSTIAHAKN